MSRRPTSALTSAAALAALLSLTGPALAAPGKGAEGMGAAGKEKPMLREESKARQEIRKQAPDQGVRDKAREERTERVRETAEKAEGKGDKTSGDMQARREERKEIQEQYRETSGTGPQAKKKPWWKFWARDDAS